MLLESHEPCLGLQTFVTKTKRNSRGSGPPRPQHTARQALQLDEHCRGRRFQDTQSLSERTAQAQRQRGAEAAGCVRRGVSIVGVAGQAASPRAPLADSSLQHLRPRRHDGRHAHANPRERRQRRPLLPHHQLCSTRDPRARSSGRTGCRQQLGRPRGVFSIREGAVGSTGEVSTREIDWRRW